MLPFFSSPASVMWIGCCCGSRAGALNADKFSTPRVWRSWRSSVLHKCALAERSAACRCRGDRRGAHRLPVSRELPDGCGPLLSIHVLSQDLLEGRKGAMTPVKPLASLILKARPSPAVEIAEPAAERGQG